MASCKPFTVNVEGDLAIAFARARNAIEAAGGKLTGDMTSGTFSGQSPIGAVKGTYTVSGNSVTFTITDRPFLAPCSTIEQKVRENFR